MGPELTRIVHVLASLKAEVKTRFKAELRGVFGSFVRSEEKPGSDVDVLVEVLPFIDF